MKLHPPTKSERTRRRIIEKAAPLINKKGIAGTSIADLAEATGLTKGSIYGNFKNKDALVLAVYDYNIETLNRVFARELAGGQTPAEKLAAYPRIFRKLYSRLVRYGGCPVINTATEADDTHPALCNRVAETMRGWKREISSLVEAGIQAGQIEPSADPARVSGLMLSLFEGGAILAKVTGDDAFMADALDHMETLIRDILSAG